MRTVLVFLLVLFPTLAQARIWIINPSYSDMIRICQVGWNILACSIRYKGGCLIVVPRYPDWRYPVLVRHELAHCKK